NDVPQPTAYLCYLCLQIDVGTASKRGTDKQFPLMSLRSFLHIFYTVIDQRGTGVKANAIVRHSHCKSFIDEFKMYIHFGSPGMFCKVIDRFFKNEVNIPSLLHG